ncbi:hypothetical protein EDC63_1442 [Sulfurirhabdus autotrophica]|uniref:Uncharacterized protein n=1 Tax=Sulfurirhabdus autotrophica TaxID=1706046 RepID=A0A4R3XU27_9PROT|nr:hypothetical protein EDC63_1442 [Sulfurirhabdus autotrophica]
MKILALFLVVVVLSKLLADLGCYLFAINGLWAFDLMCGHNILFGWMVSILLILTLYGLVGAVLRRKTRKINNN